MVKQAKKDEEERKILKEIREICRQLPRREQYRFYLYLKWQVLRYKLEKIALNWLLFQLKLDEEIKARKKIQ